MPPYRKHIINENVSTREALKKLDKLALNAILFVIDEVGSLKGSLTDGDIRRGLIAGLDINDDVIKFAHQSPRYIQKGKYKLQDIIELRKQEIKVFPVVNGNMEVVNVINLNQLKSYLPLDAVIMAGGRGTRLRPLTDKTPKPLLKVGNKPIIEHNIDRLCRYGIDDFWISVRYLGEQLEDYFGQGRDKSINIQYIWEKEALGTIGAVSQINNWQHEAILVTNSDILTNLDYENFFLDFIEKDADMSVATIPYTVDIPYAVLETNKNKVISFREKPTYTYFSNGGIYLMKREMAERIPKEIFFNSTDLMQLLINEGKKVVSFPMRQYWLDIGKPEDFEKAQEDIKHLDL